MCIRTHSLAAAILLSGLAVAEAPAAFVDVIFVQVPAAQVGTPAGLTTWRAYARFTNPNDVVLSVGGMPGLMPLQFTTNDPAGLRNLPGGDFGAGLPMEDLPLAPLSSAWDSFVTIDGLTLNNDTSISPGFLGGGWVIRGTAFLDATGGWFDGNPASPADAEADLRVAIAQFTVGNGFSVTLSGVINGTHSFIGPMGDPEPYTATFSATSAEPCPTDVNLDGQTDFGDLLHLLAAWGPCAGCPADLDHDGTVGFADLVAVLAAWGACP